MSWRTMSSGFLCSLHAWFENIPERERDERVAERVAETGRERGENTGTESSFFLVPRERFKHCSCKEKDSKTLFGTWMGEQGYRNKEGFYLLLIQSN